MADEPQARKRIIGVHSDSPHYKWWVLSCTSLGIFLATVNSGTLIIALPDLERALHTSLLALVWVILVYMITSTVLVLTAGRLSDIFGRKYAYVGGILVFALASLGAGFSGSGTELIIWRILQGIGGAFMFANSSAIVTDAFPKEELGLAMGTNTMVGAVGLVVGPVLGGALVKIAWPWVFWFNVPFGVLGFAWAMLVLHNISRRDTTRKIDYTGAVTYLIGLTGLVFALSRGGLNGWTDSYVIAGFIAAIIFLPIFLLVERRGDAPMLDLTIFKNRLFAAASGAAFLNGLSRFALMFIFVFYFQGAQGVTPIVAGVRLIPMALTMLLAAPIAGRIADRHGSRLLAALGMLITAAALAGMTTLSSDSPYWQSALWLAIVGIGSGTFGSPNTSAMMGTVAAHRRGIAAGARVMIQNTGAVISISFVLALLTANIPRQVLFSIFSGVTTGLSKAKLDPFINNMHTTLWALCVVSLVGCAVSLMRPSQNTTTGSDGEHPDDAAVLMVAVDMGEAEAGEPV